MSNVWAISIYVKDLKESTKFYYETLGLRAKKELPYLTILEHEGVDLVLCQAEDTADVGYPNGSGVVLGFPTDDLGKSIRLFQSKGVNLVHSEPQDFPAGQFNSFSRPFRKCV